MNPEKTRHWSELLKNYCQIGAILLGGWWTYSLFVKKDAPLLEARGSCTSDIKWFPTANPQISEVVFAVVLENKGTTSFDISKIHVRGWEFDFGNPTNRLDFFDPAKIQEKDRFFNETYHLTPQSSLPFPSHYPPGSAMTNPFVWLINRECSKRLYFVAEFFRKGSEDTPTWFTFSWSQECAPDKSIPRPPGS